MPGHRFRLLCVSRPAGAAFAACAAPAATAEPYDPWPGLVQDIFNNRPMNDGSDVIGIEMPYRAEDAAIVPVTLRIEALARRQPPHRDDHAGDRPESGADGGEVRARAGRQRVGNLDPRPRQQLHRCSCRGRAERRQALHGEDLREGLRRLLGARRQERRGSQGHTRPDALPAIRASRRRRRPAARAKPRS